MNEQILFLSRMEFIVLLLAGGIQHIECFPLPDAEQADERQVIEAVYHLIVDGLLETNGGEIRPSENIREFMDVMRNPETYVRIEPADASLPQKICYCGEKIVVLENVQEEDKAFRLFIIRKDDFWAWLTDSVDISATVFDKREEALHMLEFCPIAGEERALLLAQEHPEAFCKAGTWMVRVQNILKENAYASLRFVDGATGTLQKEVLFVQGSMNTWVLWCVPCADIFAEQVDCVYVEPDSVELRGKLLKTMNRRDAE